MPYTKNDYPASMKNLDKYVRLKAIDILNAMIEDGYDEENAIPIAISQAKEWEDDASNKEKSDLKDKDITDHEESDSNSARLQNKDVVVEYSKEDKVWKVISKGAKQADSTFKTKKEALNRAKEIASNKDSQVISKKKNE